MQGIPAKANEAIAQAQLKKPYFHPRVSPTAKLPKPFQTIFKTIKTNTLLIPCGMDIPG